MGDVGLTFIFPIDTASVTALTQISASMVVPSSPTMQSLMRRPSRAKKGFPLEQPRLALTGQYQGRFGIESDRPAPLLEADAIASAVWPLV